VPLASRGNPETLAKFLSTPIRVRNLNVKCSFIKQTQWLGCMNFLHFPHMQPLNSVSPFLWRPTLCVQLPSQVPQGASESLSLITWGPCECQFFKPSGPGNEHLSAQQKGILCFCSSISTLLSFCPMHAHLRKYVYVGSPGPTYHPSFPINQPAVCPQAEGSKLGQALGVAHHLFFF
jgi:hypothetical protein